MPSSRPDLGTSQRAVLEWIAAGCPSGVFSGFAHRSVAASLANRGLVEIVGARSTWSATVTDAGQAALKQVPPSAREVVVQTHAGDEKQAAKPLRPVAQMLVDLRAAGAGGIEVEYADVSRYRVLVASAERHGHVPEGMMISFARLQAGRHRVSLEPLPAWQTAALESVDVPKRPRELSKAVEALEASTEFTLREPGRRRALLIFEGLVRSAAERGMAVRFTGRHVVQMPRGRDRSVQGLVFALGEDEFCLSFIQGELTVPYEPSERDLARARRGISFPDTKQVPDPHLTLELHGPGRTFWASLWRDSESRQIEADLPQVLNEIELRHAYLIEQRAKEAEREAARAREREKERESAAIAFRRSHREKAMSEQAAAWQEAESLRRYAQAVSERADQLDEESRIRADSWAAEIRSRADAIDPLLVGSLPPAQAEPSGGDLSPFLPRGHWS